MKIKSYNIKSMSSSQFEELRIACKKQHLEDSFKKTDPTSCVEAVTGDTNATIERYRQKGYKLCYDFHNSARQHLLVFTRIQ